MSKPEEQKISRRTYLQVAGGAIAGLVVGGALGYVAKPSEVTTVTSTVTSTETVTVTGTALPPATTAAPALPGAGVSDRAVAGAKQLVASGAVPAGATIKILHVAGSKNNFEPFFADWEAKTGTKVEVVTLGGEPDVYTKAMAEATAKTGAYDIITIFSTWKGDVIESGLAKDLTDYYAKYNPEYGPQYPDTTVIEPLADYTTIYKGRRYAVDLDADVFTLTYRKDLLGNPDYASQFKSKFGYDLKVPDTWEEVKDVCAFYNGLNLKASDGERVYGGYFYMDPGWAAFTTWFCIFISKGGILFSPTDMKSMVNTPEGVDATQVMADLVPYMHPDALSMDWASLYKRYSEGKAVLTMAWPSLIKWAQDPSTSKIVDKSGSALAPGAKITVGGKEMLLKAAANVVNWIGIVSNYSKYPELGYLFWQWVVSPVIGADSVSKVGIMDIHRTCWFKPPYRATFEKAYTPQFLDVFQDCIAHSFPDLMIKGSSEYLDKLTKNINAACTKAKTAKAAMDDTAKDWEAITDRLGRDVQLEAWKSMVPLYPPDVQDVWKAKGYVS
jgi:multiple sugar transport system substrate-binding protein